MGFMGNSTALVVCEADGSKFRADALEKHVFAPNIDAGGKRTGWVGLDDPLDLAFVFDPRQERFAAFSLRVDTRRASSAAVKLQLAEKIREKEAAGQKVGGKLKKELKESITAALESKAPFIPALTDCIWDLEKNRLFVSVSTEKALQPVVGLFQTTFGFSPKCLVPKKDMAQVFAGICGNEQMECNNFVLSPFGSGSLATHEQTENKAQVAVQNNLAALVSALDEGMSIQKLRLVAASEADPEFQLDFTLDVSLGVAGLRLPKGEKGAEKEATFLLKADACAQTAEIIEALSR